MCMYLLFVCFMYVFTVCVFHVCIYCFCVSAAMAENNRLTKVSSIIRAYDIIMRAHRGEVLCTVTTAKV